VPADSRDAMDRPLAEMPDPLPVPPRREPFAIELRPPGSKSITNRLYVLAAIARGISTIRRPLRSEDCDRLLAALETLGAGVERIGWDGPDGEDGDELVRITGTGGRFPRGGRVDLGDGGTPTRFMLAAAALAGEPVVVDGSPRMRERPVAEGVAMLQALGAEVRYLEAEGRLPIEVRPSAEFRGGEIAVGRTASSQFISALLLVAPALERGIAVRTGEPLTSPSYVELTLQVMAPHARIRTEGDRPARVAGGRIEVDGGGLEAFDAIVEPDASTAVYWMAAAAMVPGSEVRVPDLDLTGPQPDARGILAVRALGIEARTEAVAGGRGVRSVFGGRLERGGRLDASDWPDGSLAVAAMAAAGSEPLRLDGLRTLRVKETDRIAALAEQLRRLGCGVSCSDDHLEVDPRPRHERPVVIETYDDHRMAMAFAVLGLVRPGISIVDPSCVAKSHPGFWRDLGRIIRADGAG
jgi:3-phosphoshikimate 1-carboxyvinyltransferase